MIGPISVNNTPEQDIRLNFDAAYWLSLPPALRTFQHIQNTNPDGTISNARGNLAVELTKQGYDIDLPIMVWDQDPYYTMLIRENEGVTTANYLSGKPIKVSSDVKNFPPFDPPAPITPNNGVKLVGNRAYDNVYYSTEAGKAIPDYNDDPKTIEENGMKFRKSVVIGIMGPKAPTHLWYRVQ